MSFLNTMDITTSALTAERYRMDVIAHNIANIDTTRGADGEPYRRRLVVFQEQEMNFQSTLEREAQRYSGSASSSQGSGNVGGGVQVSEVIEDQSDFLPVYDPTHPDADEDGYVLKPNVDRAEENIDLMAASRSYEAQITTLNIIKSMAMKAADLTR